MNKILQKIQAKLSKDNFLTEIAEKLSGSEFNSLLLEIFKKRAETITPAQLLQEFDTNRFVTPAKIDTIQSKEVELAWLKYADQRGYSAITLSPVSPFGTCAAVGMVNQNKVVSSLRGTEVVADATNVLALKIAQDFRKNVDKNTLIRYATVHRHTRGQAFDNPDFSAHFSVFCMASGGFDVGSYTFELTQLNEHIAVILHLLRTTLPHAKVSLKFYLKEKNSRFADLLSRPGQAWSHVRYEYVTDVGNRYYQTIQFKVFLHLDDTKTDIADGGMVDWTQKLLSNHKHRLCISGVGIELLQKLKV